MSSIKSSAPESPIAHKAVLAIFWNYASFGSGKVLVFLTTAILARLLTPTDFGLMGFAVLAVGYFSAFKDLGLGAALIQRRNDIAQAADTVFTLNLLLGIGLTIASYLSAPYFAAYFQQPQIIPMLRFLSFSFVFNALSSVHLVQMQRDLDFRKKLIPNLGGAIVKGVVSIGCAIANFGVWALIIGQMAGTVMTMFAVWYVYPWQPRLIIHYQLARELLRFGIPIVSLGAFAVFFDSLDRLIIGRSFDSSALGLYTLATRLPELLILNSLWVVTGAIFPVYATIQEQTNSLRKSFLATLRFTEIFLMPLGLGLLLAANPLVRLAFGEQWIDSILFVRILAASALFQSVGFHIGDVYKAVGRVDILIKLNTAMVIIQVPLLLFSVRYGVAGVAWAMVLAMLLEAILRLWATGWFLKISWSTLLAQLVPSLLGGVALSLLVVPTLRLTADLDPLLRLLAITVMGAIGYGGVVWRLEGESLQQFWSSRKQKKERTVAPLLEEESIQV